MTTRKPREDDDYSYTEELVAETPAEFDVPSREKAHAEKIGGK